VRAAQKDGEQALPQRAFGAIFRGVYAQKISTLKNAVQVVWQLQKINCSFGEWYCYAHQSVQFMDPCYALREQSVVIVQYLSAARIEQASPALTGNYPILIEVNPPILSSPQLTCVLG
jgi:hypothetical protein